MQRSPLEEPQPGETVVLFKHEERATALAVGSDLEPRQITPGQLIAAMECSADTPPSPLPKDTNERVMAAYETTRREAETRLGRARRPSDTRLRRYLSNQLRAARQQVTDDAEEARRISILQEVFLDHLPANVQSPLREVRRMELKGAALVRRLEALRERYRLSPRSDDEGGERPAAAGIVRIVCSDGLM